jgi:lipopolysaccharide transport system ATP-binding protein
MNKSEIKSKFDEIVEFSGVGNYIDTPVKRYSSGMYVRLAFAVAAHLEPEILILDEVLAVGDSEFQKKCLGKMKAVSGEGRTVLFVSHNMDAVNTLCSRVMMLEHGKKVFEGDTREGVNYYLKSGVEERFGEVVYKNAANTPTRSGNKKQLEIKAVRTKNALGEVTGQLLQGEKMFLEIDFIVKEFCVAPELGFAIKNPSGAQLSFVVSDWYQPLRSMKNGTYTYQFEINNMELIPGEYILNIWARPQMNLPSDDYLESPLSIRVLQTTQNINYSFYVKHGGVLQNTRSRLFENHVRF